MPPTYLDYLRGVNRDTSGADATTTAQASAPQSTAQDDDENDPALHAMATLPGQLPKGSGPSSGPAPATAGGGTTSPGTAVTSTGQISPAATPPATSPLAAAIAPATLPTPGWGLVDPRPAPTTAPAAEAGAASSAPATTAVTRIDRSNEAHWRAQGIDFDKLPGAGTAVPGQPGMEFAHDGQGWVIRPLAGGTAAGSAAPADATPSTTPAAVTRITRENEAHWRAQGIDFDKLPGSGTPVPGQPGMEFAHDGQGWVIRPIGGATTPGTGTGTTPGDGAPPPPPLNPFPGYEAPPPIDPEASYDAGEITQFEAPDQSVITGEVETLLRQILANPHSMSAEQVQALKEVQKEQTLAQQRSMRQALTEDAARRGLGLGSGMRFGADRRLDDAAQRQMLESYRDIDVQKMQQDREDELTAAGVADAYLTSQLGRATGAYETGLSGQVAQEQANAAAAASKLGASGLNLQSWIANQGLLSDNNDAEKNRALEQERLRIQEMLGKMGIDVDWGRIRSSDSQFDKSHGLNWLDFLERRRQFNATGKRADDQFDATMGLGWANLNSSNINNFLRFLYSE